LAQHLLNLYVKLFGSCVTILDRAGDGKAYA